MLHDGLNMERMRWMEVKEERSSDGDIWKQPVDGHRWTGSSKGSSFELVAQRVHGVAAWLGQADNVPFGRF